MNGPQGYIQAIRQRSAEVLGWDDVEYGVRALLVKILSDHAELLEQFGQLKQPAPPPPAEPTRIEMTYDERGQCLSGQLYMVPEPTGAVVPMAHVKHARQGILIGVEQTPGTPLLRFRVLSPPTFRRADKVNKTEDWSIMVKPEG
jgi:hypothetical protein